VVDEFPVAVAEAGVVIAAVFVGEVAQEDFGAVGIWGSVELGFEVVSVDGVVFGNFLADEVEDGGEEVHDGGELGLGGALGDGESFLVGVSGVWFGPSGDEGGACPAFVVGAFFSSERCRAAVVVRAAEGGIASVIAKEEDEGVFGDVECVEVVEEIAE